MNLTTPVALIIFNRPDLTEQVFQSIRQAQPRQLLVIADGPRIDRPGEAEKCAAARAVIDYVDWECEVLTNYSDTNLGCRTRVSSGLDWVFSEVEAAIILEDDCLPHPSFFRYCQELINHYREDERIWCISGDNFQNGQQRGDGSYYFSNYNHCWGWASWRRAWQKYDRDLANWPAFRDNHYLESILDSSLEVDYWNSIFEQFYSLGQPNTWDYAWTFTCWQNRGLTVLPNINLVSNIGFRSDGTHTIAKSEYGSLPVGNIDKIQHPSFIVRDQSADRYTFDHHCGGLQMRHNQRTDVRIKNKISRIKNAVKSKLNQAT